MSRGAMERLRRITGINSVFPNESELAHLLAEELRQAGFHVQMQEFRAKRYNLLASRGTQGSPLLLYGHLDTVPPYGYGNRDPFSIEERGGRLYGLGVYDMKAGLAAIVHAVTEVRNERTIKILFASDEEADSEGCYAAIKTGFLNDVAFALSTEMSDAGDEMERTRRVTLGRRGRVQYEIDIPGKATHAARMEEGISAVTQASKLAIELETMNAGLPTHPKMGRGDQFVRRIFAESVSLSLPDRAALWLDRHLVVPETPESVRQELEKKITRLYDNRVLQEADGKRATVRIRPRTVPYMVPYIVEKGHPEMVRLSRTIEDRLHVDTEYNYGLTVADENMLAMQGIPTVTYGPIGGGEHSGQEWVSRKSYMEMIDVLKSFLQG